jgi:hypothetical protein
VIGESGIDQGELAIVALEQHAVGKTEGHKPRPINDLLHHHSLSLVRPAVTSAGEKAIEADAPSAPRRIAYTM